MSDSISQIVLERECKLRELREKIPDIIAQYSYFKEDFSLYSWLKMGKLKVDRTEKNIREATKWWKENGLEEAEREDYDPEISACFPLYQDGKTKSGCHVMTINPGKFEHTSTIKKFGQERVLHFWFQVLAKDQKFGFDFQLEAIRTNKFVGDIYSAPLIQKNLNILNFHGMNYSELLSKTAISTYLSVMKMAVSHFHSLEGTIIVINAGKMAEGFFKLIRPLLKGSNLDLVVFDTNEDKWKPFILQYVDPSEIRPDFGGCKKD